MSSVFAAMLLVVCHAGAATFTVNTTGEDPDQAINGTCATAGGQCTLQAALQEANATAAYDTIAFSIGTGVQTINVTDDYLDVTQPVVIDATTQPGWLGPGTPQIVLNGTAGTDGLIVTASSQAEPTTIKGLVIQNFSSSPGIMVAAPYVRIQGNYIGLDVTGTTAQPNSYGIYVSASNAQIGGSTPAERNVISGNTYSGIRIWGNDPVVEGNRIGTNAAGNAAVANHPGLFIESGTGAMIGGTPGRGNLISGNSASGVEFWGATDATVRGNLVGTNVNGTAAIPGQLHGVVAGNGSTNITVLGNVISGNDDGVRLLGGTHVVQANYIGLDASGENAIPNELAGVFLSGTSSTLVGGTSAADRNVISGNGSGVVLHETTGTSVLGNFIGTDNDGLQPVPNTSSGISVNGGTGLVIGSPTGRNVVSASGIPPSLGAGISVSGAGITIQNNYVGTDVNGTAALPNTLAGIQVHSGAAQIGGAVAGEGNLVSGNGEIGIELANSSSGVVVEGNVVGASATGGALGNGDEGVLVAGSSNTIARNAVAFNGGDGVRVILGGDNTVEENDFDSNGGLAVDLDTDGVNTNDPDDADSGPNDLQNFPILLGVSAGGTVAGTLDAAEPGATYRIEIFSTSTCDPSGHGEGEFLEAFDVVTDGDGNAAFEVTLSAPPAAGEFITATATSPSGDTSELSACALVGAVTFDFYKSADDESVQAGGSLTYTIVVRNTSPFPATNITVADDAPAGIAFGNVSADAGSCVGDAATVSCTMATLPAGGTVTITIAATVDADATPGQTIVNTATIAADQTITSPATAEAEIEIATAAVADIPALSGLGTLMTVLLLACAGLILTRR